MVKFLVMLAALVSISISSAEAEEGPGKKETANFIDAKTNLLWDNGRRQWVEFRDDYCEIRVHGYFKRNEAFYSGGSSSKTETNAAYRTVKLDKLDPTRVEAFTSFIDVSTLENRKSVQAKFFKSRYPNNSEIKDVQTESEYQLRFDVLPPHNVNVPKLARALTHLIKLCGGKGELF